MKGRARSMQFTLYRCTEPFVTVIPKACICKLGGNVVDAVQFANPGLQCPVGQRGPQEGGNLAGPPWTVAVHSTIQALLDTFRERQVSCHNKHQNSLCSWYSSHSFLLIQVANSYACSCISFRRKSSGRPRWEESASNCWRKLICGSARSVCWQLSATILLTGCMHLVHFQVE